MRAFIILCFVAVTCAEPLGYNYQRVLHSHGSASVNSGHSETNFGIGDFSSQGVGSASQAANGGIGAGGAGFGSIGGNIVSYDNAPVELEKEFYTFSAPESEFDDRNVAQNIAGSVKQGLRVIFIKGPENTGIEKAAIALAKQAVEQKTAIYVLNKQADIGALAQRFNVINKSNNNKPEVHFVKYRTPEDAANAQKAIQSQYDSLGGTSQAHNNDVAPVLNFASQPPVYTAPAKSPANGYLPSSIFRS